MLTIVGNQFVFVRVDEDNVALMLAIYCGLPAVSLNELHRTSSYQERQAAINALYKKTFENARVSGKVPAIGETVTGRLVFAHQQPVLQTLPMDKQTVGVVKNLGKSWARSKT